MSVRCLHAITFCPKTSYVCVFFEAACHSTLTQTVFQLFVIHDPCLLHVAFFVARKLHIFSKVSWLLKVICYQQNKKGSNYIFYNTLSSNQKGSVNRLARPSVQQDIFLLNASWLLSHQRNRKKQKPWQLPYRLQEKFHIFCLFSQEKQKAVDLNLKGASCNSYLQVCLCSRSFDFFALPI